MNPLDRCAVPRQALGMNEFIIIGDSAYCLDTKSDRATAAAALRDAGISRASVWRGGPDQVALEIPTGRDFGDDGQFHTGMTA